MTLKKEFKIIHALSEMIVKAQRPVKILNSLSWNQAIKKVFLKNPNKLPNVNKAFYQQQALGFNPVDKRNEFERIKKNIQKELGVISPLSDLMQRICQEYKLAVRLLEARGTHEFYDLSHRLFGGSEDAFYIGGPTLAQLSKSLHASLPKLIEKTETIHDKKRYSSTDAVQILRNDLNSYFNNPDEKIVVELSDKITSDAAAGAEVLKINKESRFSDRDIRLLEVHEGWVHLGTTLNGRRQQVCTFLSKGPPSATMTQEGLAMLMEIFTHRSFPSRIKRLNDRILAINMVENGADFLDVFRYFIEQGHSSDTSYNMALRVFRGALPNGKAGAFTKDLTYIKGFILIYNYIRLAIKIGKIEYIPFLFVGKSSLSDIKLLYTLHKDGLVDYPRYVPPQIEDISAISAWLSFSLFMNQFDLAVLERDFQNIL